jgi:hypothetical protein
MARDRRVLPHNLDAEASILGGVLLRNDVLTQLDTLEVEDFYDHRHKVVFQAIRNLESAGKPIDIVTLENEIEKAGKLEGIGGMAMLGELALRVPTPDNVLSYTEIVQDKSQARKLMIDLEVSEYLDFAEGKVFEVTQRKAKSGPEPIKGLVKKVFSSLDERFKSADGVTGVPTDGPPACSPPSSSSSRRALPWARHRSRCRSRRTRPPAVAGRAWCSRSRCHPPSSPSACCAARPRSIRRRCVAVSSSART